MTTVNRKIIAPIPHGETEHFWTSAKEGRLALKKCGDCGKVHYYPRAICPHCLSDRTEWFDAAGTGTIYSYSTMGKPGSEYTLAYVRLTEGVTMLTNIVDCDAAALAIDKSVRVVFKPCDGATAMIPMFTLA